MSATTGLPYVPLEAFPTSGVPATGGNSETDNLNVYYEVYTRPEIWFQTDADMREKSGNIAWVITSTALVLLMIPGVG